MDELRSRILKLLETGLSDGEKSFCAPACEYVDGPLYARELAALRLRPIPLLPSAALNGTRLLHRLGISLLVTRVEGRIHVLKNRCRHRGTALVDHESECSQRLVCPYHGWSYGLDGKLLHVPEREGFPDLREEEFALHEIPSVELAGMIWIGGESEDALRGCLRTLANEPELARLDGLRAIDARTWSGGFNWKLGVSGFLETYHFKVAHKTGIAPHFVWNRLLIDQMGENLRLSLPRTSIAKQGPDWEFREHVSFVYFIFPCSFISILPDHASFITFLPDGLGRTQVESHIFVPDDAREEYWQKNAALFRQTITEDMALAASIQRGIEADPSDSFTFASFEQAIGHFRGALERLVK